RGAPLAEDGLLPRRADRRLRRDPDLPALRVRSPPREGRAHRRGRRRAVRGLPPLPVREPAAALRAAAARSAPAARRARRAAGPAEAGEGARGGRLRPRGGLPLPERRGSARGGGAAAAP